MKKIIMLLFLIYGALVYCGEGERFFPADIDVFVEIKTAGIIPNKEKELSEVFKVIDIRYLKEGYGLDIAVAKNIETGFFKRNNKIEYVIIKPMAIKEYQTSTIPKGDTKIEETVNGIGMISDENKKTWHVYETSNIYISSNKELLSEILNLKRDKKGLFMKGIKNFQTLNQMEKTYSAKVYINRKIEAETFSADSAIFFYSEKGVRKIYSPAVSYLSQVKTVDYSRFVEDKSDKIYLGRETDLILERLRKEMPYFALASDKELSDYINKKCNHFFIGEKGGTFSIVLYSEDGINDEIWLKITKYLEKNIFIWRKLQNSRFESLGYMLEIPGVGKKIYWGTKDRYGIITDSPEYLRNVMFGRYNDTNYLRIDANVVYDYNYAEKIGRNVFYREKEVEDITTYAGK